MFSLFSLGSAMNFISIPIAQDLLSPLVEQPSRTSALHLLGLLDDRTSPNIDQASLLKL